MNIRDISNDGLRQTVNQWLEKGELRTIIEREPLLAANLPHLIEALEAFERLSSQGALSAAEQARVEAALKKVNAEIEEVDGRFDANGRAGHTLLETAAQVTDDDVMRASLLAVIARLFPRGLSVLNLSASEEAGVALSIKAALDPDAEALLSRVEFKVGSEKTSALSLIKGQIDAGKRLGKLAATRDKIIADRDAAAQPDDALQDEAFARVREARNIIVRAVSDFVYDIERTRGLSAADRQLLLTTVSALSARATKRAGKGKSQPPQS